MLRRFLCLRKPALNFARLHASSTLATGTAGEPPQPLVAPPVPAHRQLNISQESQLLRPRCQAWLESLHQLEDTKLGLLELHPDVFGVFPRLHLVYENLYWQGRYRTVDYRCRQTRSEVHTQSNAKPWPQKGTGRARHGSRRSPLFRAGSQVKGPRGPESFFHVLPRAARVQALAVMLSVKLAQGDLHVVPDLDVPSVEPDYLQALLAARQWGATALFVSKEDVAPRALALACAAGRGYTLMPAYGLNVWSMVHHDALVMTQAALEQVEERLLAALASRHVDDAELSDWRWDDRTGTHFADADNEVELRF